VTRSKAMKRRASLRSKRDPSPSRDGKENVVPLKNAPPSPGPTPYWKVSTTHIFFEQSVSWSNAY
jgi:hypothetical protein